MKNNSNKTNRIQNSIKLAERTLANLKGASADKIELAQKNLNWFKAQLAR